MPSPTKEETLQKIIEFLMMIRENQPVGEA